AIASELPEAGLERARDGLRGIRKAGLAEPHLRRHEALRPERLEHLAEMLFRHTVAVGWRGVEEVHAELEGPGHRPLALGSRPADHQAANAAATEAQGRHAEVGPTQHAVFHLRSP